MANRPVELDKLFQIMKSRAKGYSEIAKIHKHFASELSRLGKEFKKEIELLRAEAKEKITAKDELKIWKEHGYSSKKKDIEKNAAETIKVLLAKYGISISKITLT